MDMIIIGYKATETGHQHLLNIKCSNCGTKGSIEMKTFSNYFLVFLIPFCPYKKDASTQCSHCKQALYETQFSSELLSEYEAMKANAKKAYWQFSGLALFVMFIITVIYSLREDNKRDILWLSAPKKGDIYEIREKDATYTLYKVNEVTTDSVYVLFNKFQSDRQSGLTQSKMNEADSYITDDYLPIAKKDLLKMREEGEIQTVRR